VGESLRTSVLRQSVDTLPKRLRQLYDILAAKGIDLADLEEASVRKVGFWQAMHRDDDGEAVVTDLARIELAPAWEDGPAWPVVQPATPARITYGKRPKPRTDGLAVTGLLPDVQIGYWRDVDTGVLTPMHDGPAIDVAMQIMQAVNPWRIVQLADYLDLAEMSSKFAPHPEFANTTQASIFYGHNLMGECRVIVGPDGEVYMLDGNHDDRLGRMVLNNAKAALRLRKATDPPASWPALSVPSLLALDEIGVQFIPGYPAASLKLADGNGIQTPLYATHERGLDVVKAARAQRQSYVQGHTHRVAHHSETYDLDGGAVEVEVFSLGSLCRNDGGVPSTKGAINHRGVPIKRMESWQHAVGVLTVDEGGGWDVQVVRIREGRAIWQGQVFTADPDRVAEREAVVREQLGMAS
jgi:hypothetical protein